MKFRIIPFIILFLASCTTNQNMSVSGKKIFVPYSSKGFALLYSENDFKKKIVNTRLDNNKFQIAHKKLGRNKTLILTNPENKISIELKITKKAKYPDFYSVIITQKVFDELKLNPDFPFIEINQRVKNKSFVAKKAEIFNEEKKVNDKAPVTKIKIDNISVNKKEVKKQLKKNRKFIILIGEFYSLKSANTLKKNLQGNYIKKDVLNVRKLANNRFELSAGPYISINTLKNDYFELNKYGFEDLDIKQK